MKCSGEHVLFGVLAAGSGTNRGFPSEPVT
jgi:hypothetical protein